MKVLREVVRVLEGGVSEVDDSVGCVIEGGMSA